jgi:uncharacterized membrane protein
LLRKKIEDTDLETMIGQLLRYGVLLSSIIVAAGGVIYLVRHGSEHPLYRQFKGEPSKLKEIGPLWHAVLHGEGRPLIQLGLLVLVATPILRIVFSIFGYLLEKDYLYVAITAVVLAVILYSSVSSS